MITTSVQALAGVLLPSATVFLLLLCNDREVLGPWVNRPWLNVLATAIVSILLVLSLVLMVTTLFSHIDVNQVVVVLGAVLVVSWAVGGVVYARSLRRLPPAPVTPMAKRATWRMPALNLLQRPTWSRGRLLTMYLLRGLPGGGGADAAGQGRRARRAPTRLAIPTDRPAGGDRTTGAPGTGERPTGAPYQTVSLRRTARPGEYVSSMCPRLPDVHA